MGVRGMSINELPEFPRLPFIDEFMVPVFNFSRKSPVYKTTVKELAFQIVKSVAENQEITIHIESDRITFSKEDAKKG